MENARLEDWEAANPTLDLMDGLWQELQANNYPPRVVEVMDTALGSLAAAVAAEDVAATAQAGVDVGQSALDLEVLYRGNVEIDRFHVHAQQLRVHAAAGDLAGVTGEVAVLEWIRDRFAASLSEAKLAALDADLRALRGASSAGDLLGAADIAARAAAELRG